MKLSIRLRIILWFLLSTFFILSLTATLVFFISNSVMRRTTKNYFISAVEENTDKLKMLSEAEYETASEFDADDIFIHYKTGYLQIDDDFLMTLNSMEFGLYTADGSLLYGKSSIMREITDLPLKDSHIISYSTANGSYLIYDRRLASEGFPELWIRGIAPLKDTSAQLFDIAIYLAAFLPFLIIIILLSGYLAARGIVRPIKKIEETTTSITDGDNLSLRIPDTGSNDELSALSSNFNKMLDRLETSFEMEKRFASDASHELRTPVSVILAQTEFSLEKEREPADYIESLEVIKRQVRRMHQLIGNMLSYTRLEQRIDNYPFESLNFLNGNAELLTGMLQNLLENAYKYGKKGGHTKVKLVKDKDKIKLSAEDDGIGIANDQLNLIFDRFFRASNKSGITGSGLGLSIVKKIVDMHKGVIDVTSKEGSGTTFTISFDLKN